MIGQDSNVYPEGEAPDLGSIRVLSNNRGSRWTIVGDVI